MTVTLTPMNLRSVRSTAEAVELLRLLRYETEALPWDAGAIGLDGAHALRLRSERSQARGYGVVVVEADRLPASLRTLGRRLVEQFHDRPLALVGLRNGSDGWRELLVVRPQLIEGGGGAVAVRKLTIDVRRPTPHDAEVMRGLHWDPGDEHGSQERIDASLDVERVTRRFFEGLREHHDRLLASVEAAAEADPAVLGAVERAQGPDRVALRIVTQVLFCYFLQRKGLLEGERAWLTRAYERNLTRSGYYQAVLEPLFYEGLAKPQDDRPPEWQRSDIPFLNGGLFERHYGSASIPLPDEVFSTDAGLLGFLDRWTFTVAEEAADESEVAVDPEMLGRVFENLIGEEELRREGTVYTPRPVVQFMCREALVPFLCREAKLDQADARKLLTDDEGLERMTERHGAAETLAAARRLDAAVADLRAIDPAVGSGAFLLGLQAELIRLRRMAHAAAEGSEPDPELVHNWRLHAIERSLFGVDVNPMAIELCRLRLWLSLLIDERATDPHPLPNLEYRTLCADSLLDFVGGVEVQQTRAGAWSLGLDLENPDELVALRERYFEEADPERKAGLRSELERVEDEFVGRIFERADAATQGRRSNARARAEAEAARAELPALRARFNSRDRVFPAFLPAFSAPDVVERGGWDVVIMNPPYVGRKEVRRRFDAAYLADIERHYGRTSDLMIHFGRRAFELAQRDHGIVAMIFNDSIFTSTDAAELRHSMLDPTGAARVVCAARTRCFEGVAVNGGVVVAARGTDDDGVLRWVENHGRPPAELAGASAAGAPDGGLVVVGRSELWSVPRDEYVRLPHRALFRPSAAARSLLDAFESSAAWSELGRFEAPAGGDWEMLSATRRLEAWKREQQTAGFYERLPRNARFVLLGLVVTGGQGLATADDRRFLAGVEGSDEATEAETRRERFAALVLERDGPATLFRERVALGRTPEATLLDVAAEFTDRELGWSRQGLIRIAPRAEILQRRLTSEEVEGGIAAGPSWVPFEKGDRSDVEGGARWRRDNPIAIDWSSEAVALLRRRARQEASYRKPRVQNEELWGQGGVTFNSIASYLRARRVPEGAIFSHKAATVQPSVDWLSTEALLAVLNAPVLDFTLRTFLGSRMMIEIGDVRRLPIPVLSDRDAERLTDLGTRALAAKEERDRGGSGTELAEIEAEIDLRVRELYDIPRDADLWVVR